MPRKKPPDKKNIDDYSKSLSNYKTVKTSLKSIIKHIDTIDKINNTVLNVNKIIIHTYQFIKLFYLHELHNNNELPVIDKVLIKNIMKTFCPVENQDKRGKKPKKETIKLKSKLKDFYDKEYKSLFCGENDMYFTHLNTLLDYETVKMITCFENHISIHFYKFFNRYLNIITNKKNDEEIIKNKCTKLKNKCFLEKFFLKRKMKDNMIKKDKFKKLTKKYNDKIKVINKSYKKEISVFRNKLNRLKKDILLNENKCDSQYELIRDKLRQNMFKKFKDDENYCYQVKCNPLNFIDILIKMSLEIENKKEKTFSVFPLRKSIIPKYVKIDTTTILHLLFTNGMNKKFYLTKGNTKMFQHFIWNNFFRLEKKIFSKKGYIFNGEISTDGFSASLLFVRKDLYNPNGKNKIKTIRKPKGFTNEKYTDDLKLKEKKELRKYNIIGVDPGVADLIFCSTIDNDDNIKTFRYSQIQRNKETRNKRYMKIIKKNKKSLKINEKTIKEYETELSKFDSKVCSYNNVVKYVRCKNEINNLLENYYQKELYRKLKWFGFINRQRSEKWMINNFEKKFGSPKDNIVFVGDYEQKRHLKFNPPTKGIGMRKIFRNAGYKVYLVDEFRTSKINCFNFQENEKFRKRQNPRPWKTNIVKYHGLLRSKSVPNSKLDKQILVNRDLNGSLNIRMIGICHINKKKIPDEFNRKKLNEVSST